MSGGKGGGQTTTAEIPEWAKEPTIRNLQRAEDVQQIGYQPYMGADLAAFNPTQMSAMQNTLDAASAFGMSAPATPMQGMPEAQTFAGGIQGYSAYPLFEQAQRELAAQNPVQQQAYDDLFVEPVTNNFDPIMSVAETNFPRVTSPSLQGGGVMDTAPAPTSPVTGLPQQTAGQAYNEKMANRGIDAVIRANPDYLKPKVKSHRGRVRKGATEAAAKSQREAIQKVLTEDLGKPPVRSDFDNYSTGSRRGTSRKVKDRAFRRALADYEKKAAIKKEFGLKPNAIGKTPSKNTPAPNKNAPAPKKTAAAPKKTVTKASAKTRATNEAAKKAVSRGTKKLGNVKTAPPKRRRRSKEAEGRDVASRRRRVLRRRGSVKQTAGKPSGNMAKTVTEAVKSIVKPAEKKPKLTRAQRAARYRGRGRASTTSTRSRGRRRRR